MRVLGVIPARFDSTRFPGKPLKRIGAKPLLQWVIEGAMTSSRMSELLVATDHAEIAQLAESCGVKAVMTPKELPTGSDRVFYASRNLDAEVIVNIQGDEPLITGDVLDALIAPLEEDSQVDMATLACTLEDADLKSSNTAKIVLNQRSEAIYFSRFPIPYSRVDAPQSEAICLKHIGLYGYRKSFLAQFCAQPPIPLELAEGLEQLRALYLGARIKVVKVKHVSQGVDTPEDVQRAEALLRKRGSLK